MDKVIDIKKMLEKTAVESPAEADKKPSVSMPNCQKATNPILKKLAQFKNDKLSKKFDINDLI